MDNDAQSGKPMQSPMKHGINARLGQIKAELLAPRNRLLLLIIAIFVVVRAINLSNAYLWYDDVASIGSFAKTDWGDILSSSVDHVLVISGPFIPTVVGRILLNIFGPHLIVLRLPNLCASLLSLLLLFAISTRLFPNSRLRYLPGLLFTFSIPSILYSQGLQPSIFFFLSTCIQLWYFVKMISEVRQRGSREVVFRHIQLFTRISVLTFFINYMSVLVYAPMMLSYFTWIVLRREPRKSSIPDKSIASLFAEVALEAVPLGALTYLRWHLFVKSHGGDSILGYLQNELFPKTVAQFARALYDALSYHFNFSYSPDIYTPWGANVASLPFVILCLLGALYFFFKHKERLAFLIIAIVYIVLIGFFEIIPLGGVRHSFTFAPFAYLAIGFGMGAIRDYGNRLRLPDKTESRVGISLIIIMTVTFGTSGVNIYRHRRSSINLDELVRLSQHYNVDLIIGYQETKSILTAMIHTQKDNLYDHAFRLKTYNEETHQELTETFLLVTNRYLFDPNPEWPIADVTKIPGDAFQNYTVTPLIEEIGPLDPFAPVQSIYYPINGFFVYLVEPSLSN